MQVEHPGLDPIQFELPYLPFGSSSTLSKLMYFEKYSLSILRGPTYRAPVKTLVDTAPQAQENPLVCFIVFYYLRLLPAHVNMTGSVLVLN